MKKGPWDRKKSQKKVFSPGNHEKSYWANTEGRASGLSLVEVCFPSAIEMLQQCPADSQPFTELCLFASAKTYFGKFSVSKEYSC